MKNPLTSWAGWIGLIGTAATILGAIGASCGGGAICGGIGVAGLVLSNVAHSLGNIASADGGH